MIGYDVIGETEDGFVCRPRGYITAEESARIGEDPTKEISRKEWIDEDGWRYRVEYANGEIAEGFFRP